MRYRYALLQRQTKVAQTREGPRQVAMWYVGRDLVTGLAGDDTLEHAIHFMKSEGWEAVPEEIGEDAALLKRPRGR
ncbi:MAG TPA: hypothetical protein VF600_02195 [Abditibacteriaceae bacterium]|jgi:hypothetical protein